MMKCFEDSVWIKSTGWRLKSWKSFLVKTHSAFRNVGFVSLIEVSSRIDRKT